MKISRKKIQAASDFRVFSGLTLEELSESDPDLYYDFFHDIRSDAELAYISKNSDCDFVGVKDNEGKYYVYKKSYGIDGPGWYEVDFNELFNYLK